MIRVTRVSLTKFRKLPGFKFGFLVPNPFRSADPHQLPDRKQIAVRGACANSVCRFNEDEESKSPREQSPLLDGKSEKYIGSEYKNKSCERINSTDEVQHATTMSLSRKVKEGNT